MRGLFEEPFPSPQQDVIANSSMILNHIKNSTFTIDPLLLSSQCTFTRCDGENGLWSFVVPQQLTEMPCKNHDCDMCKSKRESHPVHLSRLYLSKEGLITEVQSMQKKLGRVFIVCFVKMRFCWGVKSQLCIVKYPCSYRKNSTSSKRFHLQAVVLYIRRIRVFIAP